MISVYFVNGIIKKIGKRKSKSSQKAISMEIHKKVYKTLGNTSGILDFFIANAKN